MKKTALLLAFLALAACSKLPDSEIPRDKIVRVATAPDGTVLWGVHTGNRDVYFASSGTQTTESCGKNCTRSVQVPTAQTN